MADKAGELSLRELLNRAPLSPAEAVTVGFEVLSTLAALHARGRVHGAVDAGHVHVSAEGRVRLDEGFAAGEAVAVRDVVAAGRLLCAALGVLGEGRPESAREAERIAPALVASARALAAGRGGRDASSALSMVTSAAGILAAPARRRQSQRWLGALVSSINAAGGQPAAVEKGPARPEPSGSEPSASGPAAPPEAAAEPAPVAKPEPAPEAAEPASPPAAVESPPASEPAPPPAAVEPPPASELAAPPQAATEPPPLPAAVEPPPPPEPAPPTAAVEPPPASEPAASPQAATEPPPAPGPAAPVTWDRAPSRRWLRWALVGLAGLLALLVAVALLLAQTGSGPARQPSGAERSAQPSAGQSTPAPGSSGEAAAAPPPQQPGPPAVVANSPTDAVSSFYRLVAQHEFDRAVQLWSARMQAAYPPVENINQRFSDTTSLTLSRQDLVAASGGSAQVEIDLVEVRGGQTYRWVGSWYLVRGQAGWLLDQPSLRAG